MHHTTDLDSECGRVPAGPSTEVAAHALAPPENVRPRTAPLWPGQPSRCLYGPGRRAAGSSLTAPTASDLWGPGPAFTARGWSDGSGPVSYTHLRAHETP